MPVYASSTASRGSSRVNRDEMAKGSVETTHCARPARSSWVEKHTAVETHSGWSGEWPQRAEEAEGGDSERHEKSVKERGGRRRVRVAGTTCLSSMRCDANSPWMYTTLSPYRGYISFLSSLMQREREKESALFYILRLYYYFTPRVERL